MLLIQKRANARIGLFGNPSDGYGGKTIATTIRDYYAEVTLYEWERIEVVFSRQDQRSFDSIDALVADVRMHGYYGGVRLVKATIKKFVEYCRRWGFSLHDRTFAVRYDSTIPRQVGLAGSSAIIIATLRCLIEFYNVRIPQEVLPSLALSVEKEELAISAGLQDRVAQVYDTPVYMDFAPDQMETIMDLPCGKYRTIAVGILPAFYVAFSDQEGEPTEVVHDSLRARFNAGDPKVVDSMHRLAELTDRAIRAIETGDSRLASVLMNENFDIRRSMCRLAPGHVRMIEAARDAGASAKFAGSGGAIVGICEDESMFERLKSNLGKLGCRVFRPTIGKSQES